MSNKTSTGQIDEALQQLILAAIMAQTAIQRVASITTENRLGWALQALDVAIPDAHKAREILAALESGR